MACMGHCAPGTSASAEGDFGIEERRENRANLLDAFGLVRREPVPARGLDALGVVVQKQDALGRCPEIPDDVIEDRGIRLAQAEKVRDVAVVESLGEPQLIAQPAPVQLVVVAQTGEPEMQPQGIEETEGPGHGAAIPGQEVFQEEGGRDRKAELGERLAGESLGRDAAGLEAAQRQGEVNQKRRASSRPRRSPDNSRTPWMPSK